MGKYIEVPLYRGLVLDHMQCSGTSEFWIDQLKDPENVRKEMIRISTERGMKGENARWAYRIGQLALLDYIAKMQSEYTAPAEK